MSPITRRLLNIASLILHAAFDALIYQVILSIVLLILSESIAFEVRVFTSGITSVCFAAGSLYGFESLRRPFAAEKTALARTGVLLIVLNVLFALTSEYIVPLTSMILKLALFFCVSFVFRYSVRHVLARKFFRLKSARTA